ncbi:hypothetical protein GBA52_008999 [Prunus armeniaca]|nr:hypothetical protein GBA52_008999 [Prunus armeniaca]
MWPDSWRTSKHILTIGRRSSSEMLLMISVEKFSLCKNPWQGLSITFGSTLDVGSFSYDGSGCDFVQTVIGGGQFR